MVVVVEGKHDASLIYSIFKDAHVIITNGSEISDDVISEIEKVSKSQKVYLCLDPDGPGNKIRNKILNHVTNVYNVYANQAKAISKNKKKVGIEHMKKDDIIALFNNAYEANYKNNFDYSIIYKLGLADSKIKRIALCNKLNLGYCNAKQLVKRLNMHGFTVEEIEDLL